MDEQIENFKRIATSLGLESKAEKSYILEQLARLQNLEREDKLKAQELEIQERDKERTLALEAEQRKLALEAEQRKLALEAEQRKLALGAEQRKLALEAEQRKLALEAEQRKLALEAEERDKTRQAEALERDKIRELEAQTRERERTQQFELEKLRMLNEQKRYEADINASRQTSQTNLIDTRNQSPRYSVEMPYLDATTENDVAAYLKRFEILCKTQNIPKDCWATALSSKFKGNSLLLYEMLNKDEVKDYDILSKALLKRFLLTAEHFRQSFRSQKIKAGETYSQYMTRLSGLLSRWTELSHTEDTVASWRSLFLREQFMNQATPELSIFLKVREFDSLADLTHAADLYQEAHENQTKPKNNQGSNKPYQNNNKNSIPSQNSDHNSNNKKFGSKGNKVDPPLICTYCQKRGHTEKTCYMKLGRPPPNQRVGAMFVPNSTPNFQLVTGNTQNGEMYQTSGINPNSQNCYGESNCQNTFQGDSSYFTCGSHDAQQTCGCSAFSIRSACDVDTAHKAELVNPVSKGTINGKPGRVLRDTGATCIVVKQSFVHQHQYNGETQRCVLIDGTEKKFPVAIIELDTPYFRGMSKAVVMPNALYDVIIGSVVNSNTNFNRAVSTVQLKDPEPTILPIPVETQTKQIEIKTSMSAIIETPPTHNILPFKSFLVQELKQKPIVNQEVSQENEDFVSSLASLELQAVMTRGMQAKTLKPLKPLKTPIFPDLDLAVDEVKELQKTDKSLTKLWEKVNKDPLFDLKPNQHSFFVKKGLLYRNFATPKNPACNTISQLVVPNKLRIKVLEISHSSILGAHMGCSKTYSRISTKFYWPGIQTQVKRYVLSCDVCQRSVSKGSVPKASLGSLPLYSTPFQHVCVDLIGPIIPCSDRNHRYIITLIDLTTRYPEATALKNIETETVADALNSFFSRIGYPEKLTTDQGSQFMSDVMKEVYRILSIKHLPTVPWHPMGNGVCEQYNGVLKKMLKRLCTERVKDWDRYIDACLFAYRETPHTSTGFSPFELVQGRTVRGPMAILRELWTKESVDPEVKTTYQYVLDLRERIQDTCELARLELAKVQLRNQGYYNKKTKDRSFSVGEKVLLLLT